MKIFDENIARIQRRDNTPPGSRPALRDYVIRWNTGGQTDVIKRGNAWHYTAELLGERHRCTAQNLNQIREAIKGLGTMEVKA